MKNNLGFLFLPSQLFLQHSLLNKVHLPNKMHQEPACYKHDEPKPGCRPAPWLRQAGRLHERLQTLLYLPGKGSDHYGILLKSLPLTPVRKIDFGSVK